MAQPKDPRCAILLFTANFNPESFGHAVTLSPVSLWHAEGPSENALKSCGRRSRKSGNPIAYTCKRQQTASEHELRLERLQEIQNKLAALNN